ncbi:MAG: transcriptional regulator, partial [Pseudomonadota bacterium]
RLFDISNILDVPVQFFYDDFADGPETLIGFAETNPKEYTAEKVDFLSALSTPEGMQLCRAFARISDPQVRRRILDLVRSLADEPEEDAA